MNNKKKVKDKRVFLVVIDDSEEMITALRFASLRAKKTNGLVALFGVIEVPRLMYGWSGVEDISMREARGELEQLIKTLSVHVESYSGSAPLIFIREGERQKCLLTLIKEEPRISVLVLGANCAGGGPGKLIKALTGKAMGGLSIPITIVPGNLQDEQIEDIA